MDVLVTSSVVGLLSVVIVVQALILRSAQAKIAVMYGRPKPLKITEPTQVELEAKLKAAYESKIGEATDAFVVDLKGTSTKLSEQVSRLTTSVIEEELEAYQKTLEEVRHGATEAMEKIRQAVEQQRIELRQGMESDLAAERARLVERFDTKMGDIVASYIAESLGGGVDLGAQMPYILSALDGHKDEIKKDLTNGL